MEESLSKTLSTLGNFILIFYYFILFSLSLSVATLYFLSFVARFVKLKIFHYRTWNENRETKLIIDNVFNTGTIKIGQNDQFVIFVDLILQMWNGVFLEIQIDPSGGGSASDQKSRDNGRQLATSALKRWRFLKWFERAFWNSRFFEPYKEANKKYKYTA